MEDVQTEVIYRRMDDTEALCTTIERIVNEKRCNQQLPEVQAIGAKVFKVVESLVNRVGLMDSRLQASEILKVGSFYEDTKLGDPDEFDFLVVLKMLSVPGALEVKTYKDPDKRFRFVYAQVMAKDVQERFSRNCPIGQDGLPEFVAYGKPKVWVKEESFLEPFTAEGKYSYANILIKAMITLANKQQKTAKTYLDYLTCEDGIVVLDGDENTRITRISAKSVNIVIGMTVNGKYVSVDLTPCARIHHLEDLVERRSFIHPELYKAALERSALMVCMYGDFYPPMCRFRVTFTEVEMDFVEKMSVQHKHVYMYLKYIVSRFLKHSYISWKATLSSYILKTSCLHHDLAHKGPHDSMQCVLCIASFLQRCIECGWMPSVYTDDKRTRRLPFGYCREALCDVGIILNVTCVLSGLNARSYKYIDSLIDKAICEQSLWNLLHTGLGAYGEGASPHQTSTSTSLNVLLARNSKTRSLTYSDNFAITEPRCFDADNFAITEPRCFDADICGCCALVLLESPLVKTNAAWNMVGFKVEKRHVLPDILKELLMNFLMFILIMILP